MVEIKTTRGRPRNARNLVRKNNRVYINNKGGKKFSISDKEYREFKSQVRKVNYKYKIRKAEYISKRPPTLLHRDDDVIFNVQKKSTSLRKFKSKDEFKSFVKHMQNINSEHYIYWRTNIYKENYKKALSNVFGSRADFLIERINNLSTKEFGELIMQKKLGNIEYVYYDPEGDKLEQILSEINMGIDDRDVSDIF